MRIITYYYELVVFSPSPLQANILPSNGIQFLQIWWPLARHVEYVPERALCAVMFQSIMCGLTYKMFIVHTSNLSTFLSHKICKERQTHLKLSSVVKPPFLCLKFL